jgi:hypothetical protein
MEEFKKISKNVYPIDPKKVNNYIKKNVTTGDYVCLYDTKQAFNKDTETIFNYDGTCSDAITFLFQGKLKKVFYIPVYLGRKQYNCISKNYWTFIQIPIIEIYFLLSKKSVPLTDFVNIYPANNNK